MYLIDWKKLKYVLAIEAIIKFAKRMKLKIMEEKIGEELDKDDEDTVKTIIGKLKKASQAHAGQAKQLTKDLQDNFTPSMIAKLKKTYEPLKGKKINPNPLMKIFDKIDSNKDGLIQLYKADIPFVSTMAMSRLTLKHNMKADEIKKLREEVELDEEFTMDDFAENEDTNLWCDYGTRPHLSSMCCSTYMAECTAPTCHSNLNK